MEENKKEILYIPVEDILPNRFQPRLAFDEKELNELANSIIKYGVVQPIVVRSIGEKYEIIAGERRYKASVIAGIKKIPAVLMQTDDNTSAEIALLENLQRKNLTPIEEAKSYKKLIDKGFTQDDIANKLGVSQSAIANKLRLLKLPEEVHNALLYNQISERHARSLLVLDNSDLQKSLLKRIIAEKLTVKQTEDEINVMMNANKVESSEIPDDIQKFLRPDASLNEVRNTNTIQPSEKKEEEIEVVDFNVPEVIDINDDDNDNLKEDPLPKNNVVEYSDETPLINPFQKDFVSSENNNTLIDSQPQTTEINIPSSPFSEAGQAVGENIENDIPQKTIKEQLGDVNYETSEPSLEDLNVSQEYNKIERIDNDEDTIEENEELASIDSEFLDEYGEIDLPKLINKIRDFANNLGSASRLVDVSEIDLPDKYQITIEIEKK